ncbi:hypothetical protein BDR07DRAFT_1607358 [Suillus spraguei]|nr:hypothetical protein BDR07DRAFT_1607358 [Suillus spraguei]
MIWLTLSTEHVRNTVITNERGQVVYKTDTTFKLLGAHTTTIQKIRSNDNQYHMHDHFDVLGEIEWHTFGSSKFRSGGTEVKTGKFIPKKCLRGRKRVFIGPDKRPYRWDLESKVVILSRDDGFRMEVARFHRASLGITERKHKAMLEVSPEVAHMMDTVIMTFIYVEKLRRDKEEISRRVKSRGVWTLCFH